MKLKDLAENLKHNTRVNIVDMVYRHWGGYELDRENPREELLSKFGDVEVFAMTIHFANDYCERDIVNVFVPKITHLGEDECSGKVTPISMEIVEM